MSETPFVAFMTAVGQAATAAVAEIDGRLRGFAADTAGAGPASREEAGE